MRLSLNAPMNPLRNSLPLKFHEVIGSFHPDSRHDLRLPYVATTVFAQRTAFQRCTLTGCHFSHDLSDRNLKILNNRKNRIFTILRQKFLWCRVLKYLSECKITLKPDSTVSSALFCYRWIGRLGRHARAVGRPRSREKSQESEISLPDSKSYLRQMPVPANPGFSGPLCYGLTGSCSTSKI